MLCIRLRTDTVPSALTLVVQILIRTAVLYMAIFRLTVVKRFRLLPSKLSALQYWPNGRKRHFI